MLKFSDRKKKFKDVYTIAKSGEIQAFWPKTHYCKMKKCGKCAASCIGLITFEINKNQNTVFISDFENRKGRKALGTGTILFYSLLRILPPRIKTLQLVGGGEDSAGKFYRKIGLKMNEETRKKYLSNNINPETRYAGSELSGKIDKIRKIINTELYKYWELNETLCNIM